MNTKEGFSEQTIENIRQELQTELLKRGFTAPLTVTGKTTRRGEYYIEVTSTPFQTVPVIMKEIRIEAALWVREVSAAGAPFDVAGTINVAYSHFGGGQNGAELFRFSCNVRRDSDDIRGVQVR